MDITVTFDGVADPDYAAHLLADERYPVIGSTRGKP
jgi:hypothetical protein